MTPSEEPLDDLADAILEGRPIDWLEVEAQISDPDTVVIKQLRVLADLANLHRTISGTSLGRAPAGTDGAEQVIHDRWGPLLLQECVGRGAFGHVFRAWDTRLDREVALKLLTAETDPIRLDATVVAEGRLLARIRHQNVVAVYGAERINGRVGIWTEFVRGHTLEQLLRRDGLFAAQDAATIGVEVCRALAAVHDAGLLHRDIKAQNVMREDGGRIVLMDLGAGTERLIEQAGLRLDIAGTPLYLAPEILEGGHATIQSDLYNVGVLLYHLVTGSFPLHAESLDAVRAAHREGRYLALSAARPELPSAFIRAVERALDRSPDRRYSSASELEDALRQAIPADPSEGVRKTPIARWLLASAAGIAIVAAISSGDWMRGERADAQPPLAPAEGPVMRQVTTPAMGLFKAGSPSFDGRFYVNTDEYQDLALFDLATGAVRRITSHGDSDDIAQLAVLSADARSIAYQWETERGMELRAIDADGANLRVLVPAGRGVRPIEWSRDATYILCLLAPLSDVAQLVLVRASDGAVQPIAQFRGALPQRISLSPENAFVVYDAPAADASRRHDIFILSTTGGPASALMKHPADDVSPLWTPDGRHVFFVSDRSGTIDGWIVPVAGGMAHGEPTMVARNLGRVAVSGFTQKGALYYWLQTGDMDVFTTSIAPAGNGVQPERLISRFAGANSGATWSPDGRYFAYISHRSRLSGEAAAVIVLRDLRSKVEREITPALSRVGPVPLRWSPDGRTLLVRGDALDGRAGAFVLDVNSGQLENAVTVVPENLSDVGQTRWWLDSRSVAYLSPRGLVAKDLRSSLERVVIDPGAVRPRLRLTSFDLSPDRRALAFTANIVGTEPQVRALYVMPLEGPARELARVTAPEQLFLQSWIPGGRDVLVTRWNPSERVPHDLWEVSAADGSIQQTGVKIPGFTQINLIQVNPTGTLVTYTSNSPKWDLWRIEGFLPEPQR